MACTCKTAPSSSTFTQATALTGGRVRGYDQLFLPVDAPNVHSVVVAAAENEIATNSHSADPIVMVDGHLRLGRLALLNELYADHRLGGDLRPEGNLLAQLAPEQFTVAQPVKVWG